MLRAIIYGIEGNIYKTCISQELTLQNPQGTPVGIWGKPNSEPGSWVCSLPSPESLAKTIPVFGTHSGFPAPVGAQVPWAQCSFYISHLDPIEAFAQSL